MSGKPTCGTCGGAGWVRRVHWWAYDYGFKGPVENFSQNVQCATCGGTGLRQLKESVDAR